MHSVTQLFFLSNLAKHEKRVVSNWNQAIFHSHLCVTYPVDPMLNQSTHSTCTASLIAYHSIFLPDLGISSLSNRKFAINAKAFINRKPYKKVHQKKGIYWNQIKVFSSNKENPFWCKLDLAFIEWLLILGMVHCKSNPYWKVDSLIWFCLKNKHKWIYSTFDIWKL